jgi:enoyl-CoA hydratase/carnithine racemase
MVKTNVDRGKGKFVKSDVPSKAIAVEMCKTALWVTLSRPETYNALTLEMIAELQTALDAVDASPEIRSVVFSGAGVAFCAGADLSHLLTQSNVEAARSLAHFIRTASTLFDRIEALNIPTIAALNGLTLAGGLELALCCDLVIAAQSAKIGDAHAKFGQIPGGGATARLPRRIGLSRSKYLMFSGVHLTAEKAMAWGLVDDVAADTQLQAEVEMLSESIGERSSLVLRRMKTLLQRQGLTEKRQNLDAELLESEAHFDSHDQREGLLAFAEKRRPHYLGR